MFKHIHSNHFFFFFEFPQQRKELHIVILWIISWKPKVQLNFILKARNAPRNSPRKFYLFFFCHCFSKVFIPKKCFCIGILFPLQWSMGGCSYFQSRIVKVSFNFIYLPGNIVGRNHEEKKKQKQVNPVDTEQPVDKFRMQWSEASSSASNRWYCPHCEEEIINRVIPGIKSFIHNVRMINLSR